MNPRRPGLITAAIGCVLLVAVAARGSAPATTGPSTRPTGEPVAQLAPGKSEGTFHLVYRSKSRLSVDGRCALLARVSDFLHDGFKPARLAGPGEFTVEMDLRPGTYHLTVSPEDERDGDYWPSEWQRLHIDKSGRLYRPRGWLSPEEDFVLVRRMKGLSPAGMSIADARRPMLKWPAVAGATHYRGLYRAGDRMQSFDVEETQFVLGGGLPAEEWCLWDVDAQDAKGNTLARGRATFYGQGTDPATVERDRTAGGVCPLGPPVGKPYLGIWPLPTQVPKDPATPWDYLGGHVIQDEASGFIPGIEVTEVYPGSPAVEAGLVPDDVVIAVDGRRVASDYNEGDFRAFVRQIEAMEPGRQVTLTVRRFPRELTLRATIARFGAPATQPAAVAAPATVPATARAGESGTGSLLGRLIARATAKAGGAGAAPAAAAWRDVDPGSPARFPLADKPGADGFALAAKQGLAADFVTRIAELPGGGMAFGTNDGLSLWDGKELRTYTGPSFAGSAGRAVDGNSGLPANDIRDLLCDSRRRLWVATAYGVCRIETGPGGRWRVLGDPDRDAFSRRGLNWSLDVQKLFEASDGTVVLGARCSAIRLIDPATDAPRLVHRDDDPNHWVTGIAEDGRHRLWFGVRGVGVLRYEGGKVEQVKEPWVVGADVCGLCIDGAGTIWAASADAGLGALHADGTTETVGPERLPGDIDHFTTDRTGRLWVVGSDGLAVHETRRGQKEKDANPARSWQYADLGDAGLPTEVLEARDGSWWVAGGGATRRARLVLTPVSPGVRAADRFKRQVEKDYPKVGKVGADSRRVAAAGGVVVGVADRRVLRFDGKNWEDLSARLGRLDVQQVFADSKGTFWVATSGHGLIGLDPGGGVRRYNDEPGHARCVVYSLDETTDGTLYAGTQYGVYRLRGQRWEQVKSDLFQVGQVLADRRGRVWMMEVTYHKLYVYDDKRFREVKEQTELSDERMVWGSLRLDAEGGVLVDVEPRPADKVPQRTFRWDAATEGAIGPPEEVKKEADVKGGR